MSWRDSEAKARSIAAANPAFLEQWGLDAEIPPHLPALRVREGVEVRRYPTQLLTPRGEMLHAIWRLQRDGIPPRTDGALHWPAPLVAGLQALDREAAVKRTPDG